MRAPTRLCPLALLPLLVVGCDMTTDQPWGERASLAVQDLELASSTCDVGLDAAPIEGHVLHTDPHEEGIAVVFGSDGAWFGCDPVEGGFECADYVEGEQVPLRRDLTLVERADGGFDARLDVELPCGPLGCDEAASGEGAAPCRATYTFTATPDPPSPPLGA